MTIEKLSNEELSKLDELVSAKIIESDDSVDLAIVNCGGCTSLHHNN